MRQVRVAFFTSVPHDAGIPSKCNKEEENPHRRAGKGDSVEMCFMTPVCEGYGPKDEHVRTCFHKVATNETVETRLFTIALNTVE